MLLRIAPVSLVAVRARRNVTIEAQARSVGLRRVRRSGLIALGGLLVWAIIGVPFFVYPTIDPVPKHADVAVVLGPPRWERVSVARHLLAEGRVGAVLISVPGDQRTWGLTGFCAQKVVICFDPEPRTTRGEARALGRYAAEYGWTSAVVTTMPAHISRARTIVDRCFTGKVSMVADRENRFDGLVSSYAYQSAATVKAWILQGC